MADKPRMPTTLMTALLAPSTLPKMPTTYPQVPGVPNTPEDDEEEKRNQSKKMPSTLKPGTEFKTQGALPQMPSLYR